jgi:hypothetical protein
MRSRDFRSRPAPTGRSLAGKDRTASRHKDKPRGKLSGMIRAIYRWTVDADPDEFVRWWHDGTLRIRAEQPGALGSTLCEAANGQFVGIAKWESREALEQFWAAPGGGPMFPGAVLESSEILTELDDLTL